MKQAEEKERETDGVMKQTKVLGPGFLLGDFGRLIEANGRRVELFWKTVQFFWQKT